MIITIDGPAGSGKSSVAKALAKEIGFTYFDSGAMYRAVTHSVIKNSVDPHDEATLKALLSSFTFSIRTEEKNKRYFANGEDVTEQIRSMEVNSRVSEIAAIEYVRNTLVSIQRESAKKGNIVFEGRDMGTVVFPNAELKIFLTASPEVRAERRFLEITKKSPEKKEQIEPSSILENILKRDQLDSTRKHSPLRQAEDAHIIDTSKLEIEGVINEILACLERVTSSHPPEL